MTKFAPGRRHARAFTLIELMIVVAIVGVLAVLGIVGYRRLIVASHTSEATHMVQSIRVAEETYHAEAQTYISTSADGISLSSLFPVANQTPAAKKTAWTTPTLSTTTCAPPGTGAPDCFALLPVHSDGPVMYGYATLAGQAGTAAGSITLPTTNLTLNGPSGNSTTDFYWVTATGDPGGQGSPYSYVVGNSFTNDLYVLDQ